MMKTCDHCLREYSDEDDPVTPAEELGGIVLDAMEDSPNLCPECREELGILTLLGFGK
ncbi:MAG: hypothetical protein JW902_13480 [Syntrophaceae bacterium]|nr:hypothetical protein [Syntrophaceae bacterium]